MAISSVSEQTTAYLTVNFLDKNGAEQAPTSGSYTIKTRAGDSIKASTIIDPIASSVEIELTSSDNSIINTNGKSEVHIVTVIGVYGPGDQVVGVFEYQVDRVDSIS